MSSIYLSEATLPELLTEVSRRFEALDPVPEWAAPIIFAVSSYYQITALDLRSHRRTDHLAKARHLTVSLLAQFNPSRSRTQVCEVVGLQQHMYRLALQRTEERVARFVDFRNEVNDILEILKEVGYSQNGKLGHSPDGKAQMTRGGARQSAPNTPSAPSVQKAPPPA